MAWKVPHEIANDVVYVGEFICPYLLRITANCFGS